MSCYVKPNEFILEKRFPWHLGKGVIMFRINLIGTTIKNIMKVFVPVVYYFVPIE
jgi:hypothetical protein